MNSKAICLWKRLWFFGVTDQYPYYLLFSRYGKLPTRKINLVVSLLPRCHRFCSSLSVILIDWVPEAEEAAAGAGGWIGLNEVFPQRVEFYENLAHIKVSFRGPSKQLYSELVLSARSC